MQEFNRGRIPDRTCPEIGERLQPRAPLHSFVALGETETVVSHGYTDTELGIDAARLGTEYLELGFSHRLEADLRTLREQKTHMLEAADQVAYEYEIARASGQVALVPTVSKLRNLRPYKRNGFISRR